MHNLAESSALAARATMWFFDVGNTLLDVDYERIAAVSGVRPSSLVATAGDGWRRLNAAHEEGTGRLDLRSVLSVLIEVGAGSTPEPHILENLAATHARTPLWSRLNLDACVVLREAAASGKRLGVISNADGRTKQQLEDAGLGQYFDVVVDSSVVGVRKPDPAIFLEAACMAGCEPSECLYVGDLPSVDLPGAVSSGMAFALYDRWGVFSAQATSDRVARIRSLLDLVPTRSGKGGAG